jgi:hypothetical protein
MLVITRVSKLQVGNVSPFWISNFEDFFNVYKYSNLDKFGPLNLVPNIHDIVRLNNSQTDRECSDSLFSFARVLTISLWLVEQQCSFATYPPNLFHLCYLLYFILGHAPSCLRATWCLGQLLANWRHFWVPRVC